MKIILKYQKRCGVSSNCKNYQFEGGAIPVNMRMTILAREELERVSRIWNDSYCYQRPPVGVMIVLAPRIAESGYEIALRCVNELSFPGEKPNLNMWLEIDLLPCPKCGYALIWYETGYVPGYRVCAGPKHHHYIAFSS